MYQFKYNSDYRSIVLEKTTTFKYSKLQQIVIFCVMFEIVFVVFNYYCFECHRED